LKLVIDKKRKKTVRLRLPAELSQVIN